MVVSRRKSRSDETMAASLCKTTGQSMVSCAIPTFIVGSFMHRSAPPYIGARLAGRSLQVAGTGIGMAGAILFLAPTLVVKGTRIASDVFGWPRKS